MQKTLRSPQLMQLLRFFNQDTVTAPKKLQQIEERKRKYPNSFKPEVVATVSRPASVICQWVRAVCERANMQFDDSKTPVKGSPDCPRSYPVQLPVPPPRSRAASTMDETLPGWVDLVRPKPDKKKLSKKRSASKTASSTAPKSGSLTKQMLATLNDKGDGKPMPSANSTVDGTDTMVESMDETDTFAGTLDTTLDTPGCTSTVVSSSDEYEDEFADNGLSEPAPAFAAKLTDMSTY